MTEIVVIHDKQKIVLLDTEHLPDRSKYEEIYHTLKAHNKLDDAIELLKKSNDRKAGMLVSSLKTRAAKDNISANINKPVSLESMKDLKCYYVAVDSGAGFKQGDDIDVLGTAGLFTCVAVMVQAKDQSNTPCYYLAHINGDRGNKKEDLQEELDLILKDLRTLTGKANLEWSDFNNEYAGKITLVGLQDPVDTGLFPHKKPAVKLYQPLLDLLNDEYKLDITDVRFGSKATFDLRPNAKSLIDISNDQDSFSNGIQSTAKPVMHGQPSNLESDAKLINK